MDPSNNTATATGGESSKTFSIVIKLGTSSICDEKTFFPRLSNLSLLVETVVRLRSQGHKVVVVSSGAVAVGMRRMNLKRRPKHLPQVQAAAAVGQGRLMALYDELFGQFDQPIAQILLTRDNLAERAQYLNACNTFRELLNFGVVPIVNENDTVSHAEIRFGDNDTLSAIAAGMVGADYLFLLTDVDCLYTDNPRTNPDAKPVRVVKDIAKLKEEVTVSSPGSALGTGGMVTKLIAADLATAVGCTTVITNGKHPEKISEIIDEVTAYHTALHSDPLLEFAPTLGTHFIAKPNPMVDRKWWILHGLATNGALYLDAGAVRAVVGKNRSSLFAVGIVRVEGTFVAQQAVRLVTVMRRAAAAAAVPSSEDEEPGSSNEDLRIGEGEEVEVEVEIGKGLVNYSSHDIQRIQGCRSSEIVDLLGWMDSETVIHRDNIVVTNTQIDWRQVVLRNPNLSRE
ncbi:Aspartate/glutamate/uridylate kinase [Cladochytrium replicatum]|nr:Aspartate/glutamate/uridylate kinase [Cladochytrium replicatum]